MSKLNIQSPSTETDFYEIYRGMTYLGFIRMTLTRTWVIQIAHEITLDEFLQIQVFINKEIQPI